MAIGSLGAVSYDIVANDMTGTASQSSSKNLMAVGAAMTGVGIAAVAMTNDIKSSFLDFDTAMTEVKALGGVTTEEFESMRNAALDLSTQFPISATDIANAMYLMVSVGYDYQTMMATMPEVAALATAGSMSLKEATNSLINVMGVYGQETYSAAEITKVFANAVGVGKYEMNDFMSEIMKNIGVAAQLGISFSDLAAYNVSLQNSFTNAEEAGTSFNRMLIQLTDPSTVAKLKEMGIEVTNADGSFRDLTAIMGDLKVALSGVQNDAERMAIVTELFGTYGQRAAMAIMNNTEELPKLKEEMAGLNLIVDQTNTKLEGYSQQLQIAENRMEAAKIKMGEGMAPAMILVADATSLAADGLSALPEPLQQVAGVSVFAAQGLAAIGPALMGIAALKTFGVGAMLTGIGESLAGLGASASTFATTAGTAIGGSLAAGVAIGAAAGLAGVWILLKTGILDGLSDLGRAIESSPVGSVIMDALKVVLAPIGSLGAGIIALVKGDFAGIPTAMMGPLNQAGDAIGNFVDRVRGMFSGFGSGFGGVIGSVQSVFSGIGSAFSGMANQIRGVFSQLMNAVMSLINSTAGGFYAAGANIITSMVNGIISQAGGIVNAIGSALQAVRNLFPFSPAKEGPLSQEPNWKAFMSEPIAKEAPRAQAAAATVAGAIASQPAATSSAAASGGGGGDTYNVTIQGHSKSAEELFTEINQLAQQKRKAKGIRTVS